MGKVGTWTLLHTGAVQSVVLPRNRASIALDRVLLLTAVTPT